MKKKILITGVIGIVLVGGIIAFTSYNKKDLNNEVEAINNSISSSSDETSSSLPVSSSQVETDENYIKQGTDSQGNPVASVDTEALEDEVKKIEQEAGLPDGIPDEVQKLIDELEENPNKYSESDTSTPSTSSSESQTPSTPSQPSNNSNSSSNSGGGNVWVPSDPEQAKAIEEAAQGTGGGISDEIRPGDHDAARPELWN